MPYTPSTEVFKNGRIADANEVLGEFNSVATAISENSRAIIAETTKQLAEAKAYTNTQINQLDVDGGTF